MHKDTPPSPLPAPPTAVQILRGLFTRALRIRHVNIYIQMSEWIDGWLDREASAGIGVSGVGGCFIVGLWLR